MYKSKFHKVQVWTLSKGERVAMRKPRGGFIASISKWRFEGYNIFHNGYCLLNLHDGSVRYLKPENIVYIYF